MRESYGREGASWGALISIISWIIEVIVYASSQTVKTAIDNTFKPWEFFGIVVGGMITLTLIGYGIGKLVGHFSSENSSSDQSASTPLKNSNAIRVTPNTASVPMIQQDASHDTRPKREGKEGCCVQ
ncbi:MAG: hypothetical protein M1561_01390 [Gammaproteobacteria bacterium]|nr:hypothetical protein [Gammaproteobacteria bacterium]